MTLRIYVPKKHEIEAKLRNLSELVSRHATIAEIESKLQDELGQLECDVNNRAGIDHGTIQDD